MNSGTKTGRFSCKMPNLSNLPKTFRVHDEITVDYGEVEMRLIAAAFPGEDGIGADVYDLTEICKNINEKLERKVGMSPALGIPYVVAADIIRMEDVIYADTHRAKVKQFDPVKDSVEIEFNDKNLIPPTMWVPIKDIRQAWGGRVVNPQTHCPKCELPWKEVVLARFSVYDCPGCGAKKEDHAR